MKSKTTKILRIDSKCTDVEVLKDEIRRLRKEIHNLKYYYRTRHEDYKGRIRDMKNALKTKPAPTPAPAPAPTPEPVPVVEQPKGFWSKLFGG